MSVNQLLLSTGHLIFCQKVGSFHKVPMDDVKAKFFNVHKLKTIIPHNAKCTLHDNTQYHIIVEILVYEQALQLETDKEGKELKEGPLQFSRIFKSLMLLFFQDTLL